MWGSGGIALTFLTSALVGSEWYDSGSGRFTLGEIPPLYPEDRRLVGPRVGLDAVEKRKLALPRIETRPSSP
jgi:hypothetical protein